MMVDVTAQSPEMDLVRQAGAGDHESFTRLIQKYDDQMKAVAYQMMGDHDAMDDVLQASYIKAYRNLASFRAEASFSSWLHRIVINSCHDAQRSQRRRSEVSLETVADQPSGASIEDQFATSSTLHAALQQLSPDMRAVVILVDGQGLTYDEAALALDTQAGTIASRLNRARTALRHNLGLPEETLS